MFQGLGHRLDLDEGSHVVDSTNGFKYLPHLEYQNSLIRYYEFLPIRRQSIFSSPLILNSVMWLSLENGMLWA